jgi:sorbitol/mannitol transport system permease protein
MDGAKSWSYFWHIILPHLARPITVVVLIETIFLMNTFAEIKVTTVGGLAGNLTYLVFSQLQNANDVGAAAAGGLIAVILANIVSIFLVRLMGKNLEN